MCDGPQERRNWRLYVLDMIEFGQRVLTYSEGLGQDDFVADGKTYDATLRNIELLGEAARHVPDHVREAFPEIEWRRIVGARNRLAHGYLGIDDDVVWDIIETDVPELPPKLKSLLESTE